MLIKLVATPFVGAGGGARRGILADRARPAVPVGGAVRARRHQRPAWRACAVADALLDDRRPDQALRRRDRLRRHRRSPCRPASCTPSSVPNGAGKTTLIGAADRRDRAGCRPHPFRRARHHRAAGLRAQPAWARALVPDHVAVQRFHRARQRGARGAGAQRPFVPVLARCAQRADAARTGARDAGAGRARRPRGRRRLQHEPRRAPPARNRHGAGDPSAHAAARRADGRHGSGGIRAHDRAAARAQARRSPSS